MTKQTRVYMCDDSEDLYDFDLFNFDHGGPTQEEIAQEQERQEMMWTSYVNEMLSVLREYLEDDDESKSHTGATAPTQQPALTLNELLDTVIEILSEYVSARVADRDASRDDCMGVGVEGEGEGAGEGVGVGEGEGQSHEDGTNNEGGGSSQKRLGISELPPVLASLHSALPLFSTVLTGVAKKLCLYPLLTKVVSQTKVELEIVAGEEEKEGETEKEIKTEIAETVSETKVVLETVASEVETEKTVSAAAGEEEEEEAEVEAEDNSPDEEILDNIEEDSETLTSSVLQYPADSIGLPLRLGSMIPSYRNPSSLKPRCGLMKVKVAKLLQMMVCCRYAAIDIAIVELGLLKRLWDLFFLHARNNTLHCAVAHTTIDILDGSSKVLKRHLLGVDDDDCNLVGKIVASFERNQMELDEGRSRLCYMGHISMCAFELVRSTDSVVEEALENAGAIWETFQTETLDPLIKLDASTMGAPVPQPVVPDAPDHQMLLENLTAILSSLRLSASN